MTEADRIADELVRAHAGDPWHGSSARTALAGVSAAQAARRPIPNAHTIWELVLHLTGWRREVARRLHGGTPGMPVAGDWPVMPAPPTEQAWVGTLAEFDAAERELLAAVARWDPQRIDEPVGDDRSPPLGTGVSWYVMLHGVAQHDAYHVGQIAMLRKLSNV
ncbi:MAG TPA: DinB family protein [Gemmatimonadales bacterium]|jgi:uncharacterized damage-inducible protein DinB|nr:DinB family protein [Gemmatimonadales bacterium]